MRLRKKKPRTLYEQFKAVIGKAKGLPPDMSINHDHYLHGVPRRVPLSKITAAFPPTHRGPAMHTKKGSSRKVRQRTARVDEVAIRLRLEVLDEGGYVATSPDVPGLVAEGRSIVETVEIAQGLTRKIVESCIEHGDPLPPAFSRVVRRPLEFTVPDEREPR
jgi:predicted RNase H-like HicB family nuclease